MLEPTRAGTRRSTDGQWHDEAFRDPWVFADPDGDGWHMLITARGRTGPGGRPRRRRARVVARPADLGAAAAAATEPGQGFGQLEVMQVEVVDGLRCSSSPAWPARRPTRGRRTTGGVWAAPATSVLGPFDVAAAQQLTDAGLYSGKLVRRRPTAGGCCSPSATAATWGFVGGVTDPIPVGVAAEGGSSARDRGGGERLDTVGRHPAGGCHGPARGRGVRRPREKG